MLGIGYAVWVVICVSGFIRHNKTHGRTVTICLTSGLLTLLCQNSSQLSRSLFRDTFITNMLVHWFCLQTYRLIDFTTFFRFTHTICFPFFVLVFIIYQISLEILFPGKNAAVLSSIVLFLLFLTLFHSNIWQYGGLFYSVYKLHLPYSYALPTS